MVRKGTARAESCACDALCCGEEAYDSRATKSRCMPVILAMANSVDEGSSFQSARLRCSRADRLLSEIERTRQPAKYGLTRSQRDSSTSEKEKVLPDSA